MARYHSFLYLIVISICLAVEIDANESILGGERARRDQFPYQVSVQYPNHGHHCGGGIIDSQFILSAAHCFIIGNGRFDNLSYFIIAGMQDLRYTGSPAVIGYVEKIYIPNSFASGYHSTTGDIAVLKLKEPIDFREHRHLGRVRLPNNQRENYVGRTASIVGFGQFAQSFVRKNVTMSNELRFAETDILDNQICQQAYKVFRFNDKHLCAKVKQRNDIISRGVCLGDSGGLLVLPDNIVVGVLSRSSIIAKCSERITPAIYTRITNYLTFIHNAKKHKMNRNILVFNVTST